MKECMIDIETDLAHGQVWMAWTEVDGKMEEHLDPSTLPDPEQFMYCAHYGTSFDFPVLAKCWGWDVPIDNQIDTIIMSKMYDTNITGGHSLKAWGERLLPGEGKADFPTEEFDWGYTKKMSDYCRQDVVVQRALFKHLRWKMEQMTFSDDSIRMEHWVRFITNWQESNGFKLDIDRVSKVYSTLCGAREDIERVLTEKFPPLVHERYSTKQKDADGNWKRLKDDVEVFNIGSRAQIARRLESVGVKWTKRTKKTDKGGGGNIIVDEATLAPLAAKYPEAGMMLDYLTKGKRASMLNGWLKAVQDDHRVYGRVDTLGCITSRMSHSSPNMGQVEKGEVMRGNWIVDDGFKLVGVDASGLELRMLAHYMNDPEYTEQLLHGDIHWANACALGLGSGNRYDLNGDEVPENEKARDCAKTFIYAFLYGAGDKKIGSIVGGGSAAGKRLKEAFLENTPALKALREKISRIADQGHLPGLDGRRLRVRHKHAALNTLLQGAGAIVMKRALVIGYAELLRTATPWRLVAQVHDEIQSEVLEVYAPKVGTTLVEAIVKAGEYYDMRCPLDGEAKIGNSWAETH